VAFIVGSYDLRLPGPHSKLQAFVVRTQQGQPTPMEVTFSAPQQAPLGDDTLQVGDTRLAAGRGPRVTATAGERGCTAATQHERIPVGMAKRHSRWVC
jgi:hypothetical protein